MFTVKKLRRKPRHFYNFTGLRPEAFDQLLKALKPVYRRREFERKNRPGRLRAVGGGPHFRLDLSERLLMTLLYLRLYLTQPLLGYLFGLDDSNVSREINRRMLPALMEVLPMPARRQLGLVQPTKTPDDHQKQRKRISSLDELLALHPEFKELFIDTTEQQTPRPKQKRARRERYSGRKKRHTLKTQLVTTDRLVLHVSGHVPGRVNDHLLLRFTGVLHQVPEGVLVRLDRAYDGIEREYPKVTIEKAKKGGRGRVLTPSDQVMARYLNRLRIKVEHVIGRLKKYKLLGGVYRGRIERYDRYFAVISGLHNFSQLGALSWQAA
jgi:hypothetical protein